MIFILMMWVHAQTSQLYCVSRGYFSPPQHPAASQSYEQCTRIWLSPSSLEIPRGSPAAWCLLQVIIRALALTSTLADRGSPPPPGQSVIVLMWPLWYLVLQQKPQPHINRLPCADLKITRAPIARAERNLNCTRCYYLYPWKGWWHFSCQLALAHYWWC